MNTLAQRPSRFVCNDSGKLVANKDLQKVICNVLPKLVRMDSMEGREYLVVPMVILTEGVHNGSDGPLYYSPEELAKTPAIWNHKPVVVYHPERDGVGISACDPTIITNRKVGVMMNTRFEKGKLKSEAWIEKARADVVDERILEAVNRNEMMEVSTGMFIDQEPVEGEWKGEKYAAVARNFRPDHLALLPDKIGACSIADGAGFLRNEQKEGKKGISLIFHRVLEHMGLAAPTENEMSHDNIRRALCEALSSKYAPPGATSSPYNYWIEDVYDDFFIYSYDGKLYRMDYTATDSGVTLGDKDPVQVQRVTEYRTVEGAYVGNRDQTNNTIPAMDKKKLVDGLIANSNGAFTEADRERLMAFTEAQLQRLSQPSQTTTANAAAGAATTAAQQTTTQAPATNAAATQTQQQPAAEPKKAATVEEYIAEAPAPVREVLQNSLNTYNEEKTKLVEQLSANKQCAFTKEDLSQRPLGELRNLARLAGVSVVSAPTPNYAGQGNVTGNTEVEEPLVMPSLNCDPRQVTKKKAAQQTTAAQ